MGFTGIIKIRGRVVCTEQASAAEVLKLIIEAPVKDAKLELGESVAINGTCLTVHNLSDGSNADLQRMEFCCGEQTLKKTNMGMLVMDQEVHVELSHAPSERNSGHNVTGHVQGTALVTEVSDAGAGSRNIKVEFPEDLRTAQNLQELQCVAVDGVSLTMRACGRGFFYVQIYPHTWEKTIFPHYVIGKTRVNIEIPLLCA